MLAWIKKLLRLAGLRAPNPEPLEPPSTEAHNPAHGLETRNRALAQPPAGGADPDSPQPDSAERGREHSVRGGAGGTDGAAGGIRAPRHATRYIETGLGVLSYGELAPYLAHNVLALERRIEDSEFAQTALDDALLLQFHGLICGDLVPQLAGWRQTNVTVSLHMPPDFNGRVTRVWLREILR